MSNIILDTLKPSIDDYFDLMAKFLEACPADLWAETVGGWPLWQQFCHVLWANDLFIPLENKAPIPIKAELAKLTETSPVAITAAEARTALENSRAHTQAYLKSLSDQDLSSRNEKIFAVMQREWSHAYTIAKLQAHAMYHIGTFDAGLRNRGLSGVF